MIYELFSWQTWLCIMIIIIFIIWILAWFKSPTNKNEIIQPITNNVNNVNNEANFIVPVSISSNEENRELKNIKIPITNITVKRVWKILIPIANIACKLIGLSKAFNILLSFGSSDFFNSAMSVVVIAKNAFSVADKMAKRKSEIIKSRI